MILASFFVHYAELKAMLNLVSKDDARFPLQGLHFEVSKDEILIIVTDGRCLGALRADVNFASEPVGKVEFTMHKNQVALVAKKNMANAAGLLLVTVEKEENLTARIIVEGEFIIKRAAIDAEFPKWRKVVPRDFEPGSFSLHLGTLEGFTKVVKHLRERDGKRGSSALRIRGGGSLKAYQIGFEGVPEFYGIQMPYRTEGELSTPDWLGL